MHGGCGQRSYGDDEVDGSDNSNSATSVDSV
jgi:hypothetical protein